MLISASQMHDGYRFLPAGSALEVTEAGEILVVHEAGAAENAVHFKGLICPGFVNAHCHLELSHLQDVVAPGCGLIDFLKEVPRQRFLYSDEQRKASRHLAFEAMLQQGIVAVGDIANTTDTLDLRALDRIHFHTFVEALGFTEERAAQRMADSEQTAKAFSAQIGKEIFLRQSITPHAPYSVSEKLFRLIDTHQPSSLLAIHNGESVEEDAWYRTKEGGVADLLSALSISAEFFQPSGKSALETYTGWLSPAHSVMFVHNTYTTTAGVEEASARFRETYWCLCPGANLYIEGRVPDVPAIMNAAQNICIGTDSLASNTGLSIWNEIQILMEHFPDEVSLETALCWATSGGAAALNMQSSVGSFERGKKPGVLHIDAGAVKRLL